MRLGEDELGIRYEAQDDLLGVRLQLFALRRGVLADPASWKALAADVRRLAARGDEHLARWISAERSAEGVRFLVGERLVGVTLDGYLARSGPLPWRVAVGLLVQVLEGLAAVHAAGDPAHLGLGARRVWVLDGEGPAGAPFVKLLDAGLVHHALASAAAGERPGLRLPADVAAWAAPELVRRARGEAEAEPDARSDVYAVGALAFRLLAGCDPWPDHEDPRRQAENHLTEPPRTLRQLGVRAPRALERFVRRALEKDPRRRPAGAEAALAALRRLEGASTARSAAWLGAVGLAALALVAGVDRGARREVAAGWDRARTWVARSSPALRGAAAPAPRDHATRDPANELGPQRAGPAPVAGVAAPEVERTPLVRPEPPPPEPAREAGAAAAAAPRIAAWRALEPAPDAAGRLWLGPERAELVLGVVGEEAALEPWLLDAPGVVLRDGDGRELEGWSASVDDDARIRVVAPADGPTVRGPLALSLVDAAGAELRGPPLEATYLGRDAWRVHAVEVAPSAAPLDAPALALPSGGLDPLGLELRVAIDGAASDLLGLALDGAAETLAPEPTPSGARVRIPLASLPGLPGAGGLARLAGRVVDRAGRGEPLAWSARIVPGPLAAPGLHVAGEAAPPEGIVATGGRLELAAELPHPADVVWRLLDEDGAAAVEGAGTAATRHAFALDPDRLAAGGSFRGTLVVEADDSATVLRADPARGRSVSELPFVYRAPPLELVVTLPGAAEPLAPGERVYVHGPRLDLRLSRGAAPALVEVEVRAAEAPAPLARVPVDLRASASDDVGIELPGEGLYRLRFAPRRVDPETGEALPGTAARTDAGALELWAAWDRTPARLSLASSATAAVLGPRAAREPLVADTLVLDLGPVPGTPVALTWELSRAGPHAGSWSGETGWIRPEDGARIAPLRPWLGPDGEPRPDGDGDYRLVVRGVDRAGNEIPPSELTWSVAATGPAVELLEPAPAERWSSSFDQSFALRVGASDANGVDSVACRVWAEGDEARSVDAQLARPPAAGAPWTATLFLPPAWEGGRVRLRLVARDRFGTECAWSPDTAIPIDFAPTERPARIELTTRGGTAVGAMRLVAGNPDAVYLFGGRGDDVENRAYHAVYGLPPFDQRPRDKSWTIPFAPGEIAPFYLDEREVAVREFLAFLEAVDGYDDPRRWSRDSAPAEARRRELLARLESADPDAPVTGVDWEEAGAFASWVGKRLPTLVEWEVAVRGGPDAYRPYSSAAPGAGAPDPASFNHDPRKLGGGGPWAVEAGADVTPDTGIRSLCSNAAEWTATPFERPDDLGASSRAVFAAARRNAGDGGDAPATAASFWIAGGSWDSAGFDFTRAREGPRGARLPSVGFRCALSATAADDDFQDLAERGLFVERDADPPSAAPDAAPAPDPTDGSTPR